MNVTTDISKPIRIQKWIGQLGLASRREAERWIRERRVSVDGEIVSELGAKILPGEQSVEVDGKPIGRELPPRVYWMFYKPDRCITSKGDPLGRLTIFDTPRLSKLKFSIASVGRLDYRTEGLLLLSNDGEFVHRLMHPRYKVPRRYYALVDQRLSQEQLDTIRNGLILSDGPVQHCEIRFVHRKQSGAQVYYWYDISVFEGRNRLVRRMFEAVGSEVKKLIRYGFGDLMLPDDLMPGEYIQLSSKQIRSLKMLTELDS